MEESHAAPPLIKMLASSNATTRDRALRLLLKTWLPSQPDLSDQDMNRLWKGLFYCVWHSDKLPVQSLLLNRLSALLPHLDLPLAVHYFSSFLLTMRREWSGIDRLRLDKFYLLIRKFLHYIFVVLKTNGWDSELTRRLMDVLGEKTFLADDKFQGNGVNYHIGSVFLEELRPFLPLRSETLELLFKPFLSVMRILPDRVLLGKLKSNMFDELLKMGRRLLEMKKSDVDMGSMDDVVVLGTISVVMGFSGKFYELGSSPECCQGNRKVLFSLHEDFLKLEKEAASMGIEISVPQVNLNGGDDEVSELVPIAALDGVKDAAVESAGNGMRKCKKTKKASADSGKKSKKKKKDAVVEGSEDVADTHTGENPKEEQTVDESLILNESVIANLQMQFEKVAADVCLENGIASACEGPKIIVNGGPSKKRKRARLPEKQELAIEGDAEGGVSAKSVDKSAKKVKFSMKSNLVWKPHSLLPPQSMRIPPSVTPRGSALKEGVSPGPIREMPVDTKKAKRRANPVKGRKKLISPGVKRPRKLKSLSG